MASDLNGFHSPLIQPRMVVLSRAWNAASPTSSVFRIPMPAGYLTTPGNIVIVRTVIQPGGDGIGNPGTHTLTMGRRTSAGTEGVVLWTFSSDFVPPSLNNPTEWDYTVRVINRSVIETMVISSMHVDFGTGQRQTVTHGRASTFLSVIPSGINSGLFSVHAELIPAHRTYTKINPTLG